MQGRGRGRGRGVRMVSGSQEGGYMTQMSRGGNRHWLGRMLDTHSDPGHLPFPRVRGGEGEGREGGERGMHQ